MVDFTNKDIEFLSNRELVELLRSLLQEIDLVASAGAHRSTTYLAVSAIEGLFGELLKLLDMNPGNTPSWPFNRRESRDKTVPELTLAERETILEAAGALPRNFERLYAPVRTFRNYMHADRELRELSPINQSSGQLALSC